MGRLVSVRLVAGLEVGLRLGLGLGLGQGSQHCLCFPTDGTLTAAMSPCRVFKLVVGGP